MEIKNGFADDLNEESDGNTSFLRAARAGHLDKVLEHLKSNIDINTSNANGLNALHLSSKDGHVTVVEELLRRGALVDSATKKGNTALHIASLAGQEEVVKLLVLHGATVNVQSQNGFTPLYMAAQENHDNVVRYLLANGANQTLATEDGFTPLAVAMQQGHDKVVTVLLESDTRGKVRLPALHIAAKKDDVKAAKLLLENEHNPDVTSKSGFTPLHIASHYGNDAIGHLLIQKGADANYAAKHNITPLHVAAKWGKTNMVALLLEKGATIEAKTRDGLTPLHCAARSGHEQVVDMLVERGAPISCKTKNGLAPLHMAAQGDHVDAARILLYHRAPVDEVTVDYLTALHVAAHCGHVRVAKLLLDRQADANARALNGFTPLHIACKKNRIKVVELLLKHGASIGATTESGLTPLHVASFMGCMNIVIYLLQHDANPDVPTVRGETPLHLAARANQTDIIRILLRNGAQVDARAREQQTPLHIASRLGNVDIVMLLLQHGAKVDTATKDMYTALHIAAKEGQDEVAAVLIDNGASLNATTKKGFTPLHLAAKYGQMKVAKLLLQKEASVDTQGKNGVTPLHVAAHYDHQNVALLLLDKGASPHASAKNGHTPLHIAAKKNQMDIANTLLEYGARPGAESKAGFTPLHLSAQEGHTDMSALLIEHQADCNQQSKNGLTPLHLCAQEDRVPVAEMLVKNSANIESTTKGGFTPLHVASHYGQVNMVRFLLGQGADVQANTSIGYTPLHQAAQQGHTNIVNMLLEKGAEPNATTSTGQTPLGIAQKLGYINVIETLKVVTTTTTTTTVTEEKYKVIAPEAMQETFMSDSEEEGGEDTMLGDNAYRYLTADEMKSLGDDSLPIDVTRDERIDSNKMALNGDVGMMPPQAFEDSISPQHYQPKYTTAEYNNIKKYAADNVDLARQPISIGFLVSFLVDARGGAMRGCRHSGVRVIVPPRSASSPTRITCRYVRPQRTPHPPPLMEGEALASRVLELGPVGSRFLGPVIIEVPHFAALRGKEREIVVLRSDNGETWREHNIDQAEEILNDVLHDSFEADDLSLMEDPASGRITRILTHDFPQYFAVVSRIRQEVHAIGPEGGMVSSTVVPQVQAVFPAGALTKKIKVGLQAQPIDPELTAKLLGHGVAVSPVVTVEPRRRKFHKAITLSMPAPRAHSQGMINQYSGSAPTLRLLCSITGGTTRAQWEDVTGSTPLTFVNDCVSFTTTVSARFWLMDCRNIQDAAKMATELYREAIHVPFMAKFVVFAKRVDPLEARLRVFCMTDDKEDKTLEHQEHFTEVAKSRDVEVLEGKPQYIEFAGNLVPITKSGEQLQFAFRAFRENRLPFSVRVKDQHAEAIGRSMFMKEPKVAKGDQPQQPICILNIVLPEDIVADTISLTEMDSSRRHEFLKDGYESYRPDPRISDISNLLGDDWVALANQLGLTTSEINVIKSEYPDSVAKQAQSMLRMWIAQSGNRAQSNILEVALRRIGREEIIPQCLTIDPTVERVTRPVERLQEAPKFRVKKETSQEEKDMMRDSESVESLIREDKNKKRESYDKYSAEEKVVEEPSEEEEEDFNVTVTERRVQIEKRLSQERQIPASTQRVEIVQEISSIKRQSLVEDKIMQVEKTMTTDVKPSLSGSDSSQSIKTTITTTATTADQSTRSHPEDVDDVVDPIEITTREDNIVEIHAHKPEFDEIYDNDKTQTHLLEAVTHELEVSPDKHTKTVEQSLLRLSRTPPPSPADFLLRDQPASLQECTEVPEPIIEQAYSKPDKADNNEAIEAKVEEGIIDGKMVINIDKRPKKGFFKNIKSYLSKSFDTDGLKKRKLFGRQKSVQITTAPPTVSKTDHPLTEIIIENQKEENSSNDVSLAIHQQASDIIDDVIRNSEIYVNKSAIENDGASHNSTIYKQKSRNKSVSFTGSDDQIAFINDCINDIQDELLKEEYLPPVRKRSIVEELLDDESEPLISTPNYLLQEEHNVFFKPHIEIMEYSSSEGSKDGSYMNLYNPSNEGYCQLKNLNEFEKDATPELIYEIVEDNNILDISPNINSQTFILGESESNNFHNECIYDSIVTETDYKVIPPIAVINNLDVTSYEIEEKHISPNTSMENNIENTDSPTKSPYKVEAVENIYSEKPTEYVDSSITMNEGSKDICESLQELNPNNPIFDVIINSLKPQECDRYATVIDDDHENHSDKLYMNDTVDDYNFSDKEPKQSIYNPEDSVQYLIDQTSINAFNAEVRNDEDLYHLENPDNDDVFLEFEHDNIIDGLSIDDSKMARHFSKYANDNQFVETDISTLFINSDSTSSKINPFSQQGLSNTSKQELIIKQLDSKEHIEENVNILLGNDTKPIETVREKIIEVIEVTDQGEIDNGLQGKRMGENERFNMHLDLSTDHTILIGPEEDAYGQLSDQLQSQEIASGIRKECADIQSPTVVQHDYTERGENTAGRDIEDNVPKITGEVINEINNNTNKIVLDGITISNITSYGITDNSCNPIFDNDDTFQEPLFDINKSYKEVPIENVQDENIITYPRLENNVFSSNSTSATTASSDLILDTKAIANDTQDKSTKSTNAKIGRTIGSNIHNLISESIDINQQPLVPCGSSPDLIQSKIVDPIFTSKHIYPKVMEQRTIDHFEKFPIDTFSFDKPSSDSEMNVKDFPKIADVGNNESNQQTIPRIIGVIHKSLDLSENEVIESDSIENLVNECDAIFDVFKNITSEDKNVSTSHIESISKITPVNDEVFSSQPVETTLPQNKIIDLDQTIPGTYSTLENNEKIDPMKSTNLTLANIERHYEVANKQFADLTYFPSEPVLQEDIKNDEISNAEYKIIYDQKDMLETQPLITDAENEDLPPLLIDSNPFQGKVIRKEVPSVVLQMGTPDQDENIYLIDNPIKSFANDISESTANKEEDKTRSGQILIVDDSIENSIPTISYDDFSVPNVLLRGHALIWKEDDDISGTNNNITQTDSYVPDSPIQLSKQDKKNSSKENYSITPVKGHDYPEEEYNFFSGYDALLQDYTISIADSIKENLISPANNFAKGMSSQGESSHAIRSEEVQQKDDQTKTSETRKVKDQQELSQEMKDILKALNEDSYK